MKRKMKYALLCMGMMLFSMQGMAQSEGSAGPEPKKEHFREIPNPEKTARKEAEQSKMEAELNNLRNQLNPHFLLNTLNNI